MTRRYDRHADPFADAEARERAIHRADMERLTAHHDRVSAILAAYDAATLAVRDSGRAWYPSAERIIAELAAWSTVDPARLAAVMAALSPRNPWAWNVADAAAFAWSAGHGEEMPSATTFSANRIKAWRIATGATDWALSGRKIASFVRNMTGDPHAVTVDVWAVRVATRGQRHKVDNDTDYAQLERAYRDAAQQRGETPRDMQAITWLQAQSTGLGSKRTTQVGRHLKRGTVSIVGTLLGLPWQSTMGL